MGGKELLFLAMKRSKYRKLYCVIPPRPYQVRGWRDTTSRAQNIFLKWYGFVQLHKYVNKVVKVLLNTRTG